MGPGSEPDPIYLNELPKARPCKPSPGALGLNPLATLTQGHERLKISIRLWLFSFRYSVVDIRF